MVKQDNSWLVHFETVSDVNSETIKECLKTVPIDKAVKLPSFFRRLLRHAYVCTLDEATARLVKQFQEEAAIHEKDKKKKDVPYEMDFVVQLFKAEGEPTTLDFDVRLFHQTEPGNIYYGLSVTRPGENVFILTH